MRFNLLYLLYLVIFTYFSDGKRTENRQRSKRNQIPYLENKDGVAPEGSRKSYTYNLN